jgi:hypothetical protein
MQVKPTLFTNDNQDSRANLARLTGLDPAELPNTSQLGAISTGLLNGLIAECGQMSMAAYLRSKGTPGGDKAAVSHFTTAGAEGMASEC